MIDKSTFWVICR